MKVSEMTKDNKKEEKKNDMFPIRLPDSTVAVMDAFIARHPELGNLSRQELAERAVNAWIAQKKEEMKGEAAQMNEKLPFICPYCPPYDKKQFKKESYLQKHINAIHELNKEKSGAELPKKQE